MDDLTDDSPLTVGGETTFELTDKAVAMYTKLCTKQTLF